MQLWWGLRDAKDHVSKCLFFQFYMIYSEQVFKIWCKINTKQLRGAWHICPLARHPQIKAKSSDIWRKPAPPSYNCDSANQTQIFLIPDKK